jgi:hypothetical protein
MSTTTKDQKLNCGDEKVDDEKHSKQNADGKNDEDEAKKAAARKTEFQNYYALFDSMTNNGRVYFDSTTNDGQVHDEDLSLDPNITKKPVE